jgi:hypothetical protein
MAADSLAMRHPRLGPAHHRVGVGSASDGERDEERGLARERGHSGGRRENFVVRVFVDCAMRLALAQCHPNLASAASHIRYLPQSNDGRRYYADLREPLSAKFPQMPVSPVGQAVLLYPSPS